MLRVLNFAVRYVGVCAADGSVVHQADAAASSKLVFHWTVCREDAESLHESEVKCDLAVERGVPYPETSYCTKAELDHIAMAAASSHEATLRQKVDQDNVVVMCKCAPTKIDWRVFLRGVDVHVYSYVGVKSSDGEINLGACAKKNSQLIFAWAVRCAGREETCEVSVRCDNAKSQGVPSPHSPYCTAAELEQIGNTAAAKHQVSLRQRKKRTDIYVQCRYRILM